MTSAREAELESQKNAAYTERNQCVAALARACLKMGMVIGVGRHPAGDTKWEDDWRTILFIDLPTGQVSWHFHDSEKHLLDGLPEYTFEWDGHSTTEKYKRLGSWDGSAA